MIDTVSDLLLQLKNKEVNLLKQYDIVKHPGIIGSMYEGLTKDLMDRSIFKGLDLRITAGKIRNSSTNELSAEIDCMIVIGEGERIPYTDKFIYDSKYVIAVFQVKKNLFSKDIKDSFENLRSVLKITEVRNGDSYQMRMLRGAYRLLCKEEMPERSELAAMPKHKQMLYHILLLDAFHPVRIVWGYNGFSSEFSLRESFFGYLEQNFSDGELQKKGYGPLNFPNLIISDKYSLVKCNGMPFVYPLVNDDWWPIYSSSHENPLYFLLEVIWTRLDFMFNLSSEIYGDDLKLEQMHGYLLCKYGERDNLKGWQYSYVKASKEFLEKPLEHKDWEPVFITYLQFVTINKLCKEPINMEEDKEFISLVKSEGYELEAFLEELRETGLVDITETTIDLITEQCLTGAYDGKYFAGENNTGRVTRWVEKQLKKD